VALNRQEKAAVIEEITGQLASAQAVVVAEYVLKNTLAKRAIAGTAFEGLSSKMAGPLIYGISSDPVAAAKVLVNFAKTNDKLVLTGGALPGQVMGVDGVKALATMPSRDELLSKLLGTMQAPIATFVRTLNEVPTKFVRGVAAVRDQKESQAA
jgi:large subunit ribosomal protein L10